MLHSFAAAVLHSLSATSSLSCLHVFTAWHFLASYILFLIYICHQPTRDCRWELTCMVDLYANVDFFPPYLNKFLTNIANFPVVHFVMESFWSYLHYHRTKNEQSVWGSLYSRACYSYLQPQKLNSVNFWIKQ